MARRKRRNIEEPENHERWLVSYADFITLLFAFFVVMYSISSVNDGKYRVLAESLEDAFSHIKKNDDLIPIGEGLTSIDPIPMENPAAVEQEKKDQQLSAEIKEERQRLKLISEQFNEILEPYIDKKLIAVKKHDFWLELEMKSGMLFASGEADLASKAIPVLKKIAETIRHLPNSIHIEGHTDNIPIDTVEFPSNWDLSSARASSVVREFEQAGIAPSRLAAIGYGEFHPIADNKLEEGRFKNRRVVLVLISQALDRYTGKDSEREKLLKFSPIASAEKL
jgi:chemotaxis protein MotB